MERHKYIGSNFRLGTPGQPTRIAWYAADGANNLFPQAVVVDSDGKLFDTVDLSNITVVGVEGGYEGTFTPTDEIEYNVYYTIYSTSGNRDGQTSPFIQGDFETVKAEIFQSYNSSASMVGITDDEIKAIQKGIKSFDVKELLNAKLKNGETLETALTNVKEFESIKAELFEITKEVKNILNIVSNIVKPESEPSPFEKVLQFIKLNSK